MLEYLTENSFDTKCRTGYNIVYSVQARLFFLIFYEAKARIVFQLGGQIIYFIYKNCQRCLFHQKLVSYYFKI
jgi:hypothetical protein